MSRRDIYHDTMKRALERDGWKITHDPFPLEIGEKTLSADLGAERLVSAEKGSRKIVVEVKSFVGRSDVRDLQRAVGQYIMYDRILRKAGAKRISIKATQEYAKMLEEYTGGIAAEAAELAEHSGRNTVLEKDILLAKKRKR